MFINLSQIQHSLAKLSSVHPFFGINFLSLKKVSLPLVQARDGVNFTAAVNDILFRYYKPLPSYEGFYSPFATSNKANRWQNKRYASTTLQRITADTFGDAFVHPKATQQWGWKKDYVSILGQHLPDGKVPAFHLAVWLFRREVWHENVTREDVRDELFRQFAITEAEIEALFDSSVPDEPGIWLQDEPVAEAEVLNLIGYPDDAPPSRGAVLQLLEMAEIGPATRFVYEPSERLNIITGDNSLGKTFLFDTIWWALTGEWVSAPARPRPDALLKTPRLTYEVKTASGEAGRVQRAEVRYDWGKQQWTAPKSKSVEAGLAIYARYDGSFAIWDSTRREMQNKPNSVNGHSSFPQGSQNTSAGAVSLMLTRDALWNGLQSANEQTWLCNGLIRDWVSWQLSGPRYEREWNAFRACMKKLSPFGEALAAGEPTRVNVDDAREIPTVVLPYGPVPLIHASAGVQRVLGLAYILVWSWFRHLSNSEILRQEPQRRLVLLMDEVEAHLHPRWQRVIVPALMEAVEALATSLAPQIHLATHSPLVMASTEVVFDEARDDFHHLRLVDREVVLEEVPFFKHGSADFWLMSEAFELDSPRSLPAERAIKDALTLQIADNITSERVADIDRSLKQLLGENDEFWPRWRFFAKQHGIN